MDLDLLDSVVAYFVARQSLNGITTNIFDKIGGFSLFQHIRISLFLLAELLNVFVG